MIPADSAETADTVRWGLLGAARIAENYVLPAIQRIPGSRLHAVSSRRRDAAQRLAHTFHAPRAYDSYARLLDDPDVDAVYIALPNALHASWTQSALAAGKHVLCEKPMATSVSDLDKIDAAAQASGQLVAEAFMYRHHPQFTRLLELVASGAIGTVYAVRGALSFCLDDTEADIRMAPELGGGAILDLGCYIIDACVAIYGDPPCAGGGTILRGPTGVDVHAAGTLEFPGGRTGTVEASFRLPWLESRLQVCGDKGSLILPHAFNPGTAPTELIDISLGKEPRVDPFPGVDMYERTVSEFANAIRGRSHLARSLSESRAVQVGVAQLLASAA
ncbi:Gfo/Idh/MocA family oxidoreductase [Streptomyces sp. NBS 14/10]|uniref:Gfo/Idh/MocA family protein n=1 Tax=Streptomyces sp. NBS 14/10 TaxID=1945643 RepID=UPI000B7FCAC1|nr:Gfo/Idh/MocA family oxidoreductase [Streptomyces sp. NBS 14/10]KAK1184383.1 Gfo/Idh/MocA family oxidoreductase [Streptomyces sp. NBS 14/10]